MTDPLLSFPLGWLVAVALGGGIGVIAGLFGVGGGFLLVPLLNLVLGIPISVAVGSSTCQILGPATTSLAARDLRIRDWRLPLVMTGGLLIGVSLGAVAINALETGTLSIGLNVRDLVLGIYFVLMTVLGLFALWETSRQKRGVPFQGGWLARISAPPRIETPHVPGGRISLPVLAYFGFGVGLLSGFLGMSGGLVLVPGLVYLLGFDVRTAARTSLMMVAVISVIGTIAHAWNGYVDLPLVAALLVGGTVGARVGTGLARRLGNHTLRGGFGWLLLAAATFIAIRRVF